MPAAIADRAARRMRADRADTGGTATVMQESAR